MKNVGGLDQTIRIILAMGISYWGLYAHSLWGLVAIVPLITASAKTCPLYLPLGLRTCSKEDAAK